MVNVCSQINIISIIDNETQVNELRNQSSLRKDLFFKISVVNTVELQWLEYEWLVYHSCFELGLESLGENPYYFTVWDNLG